MSATLTVDRLRVEAETKREDSDSPPRSKQCGLKQCRKLECNLNSHRQFAASRGYLNLQESASRKIYGSAMRKELKNGVLDQSIQRIERLIADGFPHSVFNDEVSSILRELGHHYFTNQMDRLIQLYSPHLDRRKYKSTMVDHALSNDVFCVCITANAKTDLLMRRHIRRPDRSSELVYAMTAFVLRQKLTNFKQTDLDWLLVLVVALVGFDLAFQRIQTLRGHHEALKTIITMKGGIHAVGHTLPYVLNTDRFLAIFTGSYPMLRQSPMFPTSPRFPSLPTPYGIVFKRAETDQYLDQPVIDLCLNVCQLVHVIESSHISFDPKSHPSLDPSIFPYFLYLRDQLFCAATCLHADYHENQNHNDDDEMSMTEEDETHDDLSISKSRCVLLAAMLIQYTVAHNNYYTVIGPFLGDELRTLLDTEPSLEWSDHINTLLWVLFVFAALAEEWEHHSWCITKLKHLLKVKYCGKWPQFGWKEVLLVTLNEHVWSQNLRPLYRKVCVELDKTL